MLAYGVMKLRFSIANGIFDSRPNMKIRKQNFVYYVALFVHHSL